MILVERINDHLELQTTMLTKTRYQRHEEAGPYILRFMYMLQIGASHENIVVFYY